MITHYAIRLKAKPRGFHLITNEILQQLPPMEGDGLMNIHIMHTSAGLCINENADPDVLHDFELYFNKLAPENMPAMKHTIEGLDDMPAHIKATLTGHNTMIPVVNGQLALGTWQGIYLCEFRNAPRVRNVLVSIYQ